MSIRRIDKPSAIQLQALLVVGIKLYKGNWAILNDAK